MPTLLDTMMQQLTPDTVSQVSRQLGVDEQMARKGIEMGMPLLMTALARKSSTPEGAQALSNALSHEQATGALDNANDPARMLESGTGNAILDQVLGNQRQPVETALSQVSGIDAGSLLQMLAPMLMGALSNTQQQQNLDADGLAKTVQNEQQQMAQSNPLLPMLTQLLDANKDGSIVDDVAGMVGNLFNKRK